MATDKKINYKDKRLTKKIKPVNQGGGPNYLGKQKEVTVPKKWLSSPDHVVAELAYITPREQKILLDADLYGSLKGKPNKGPGGIMSLQGDLGGYDASPGGPNASGAGGGSNNQDRNKQRVQDILRGNVTTGQTVAVSDRTRRNAVPEYARGPDGNMKYIGSSQKAASNPQGFLGRLFSGNNRYGYRDIYNKTGGFMGFGGKKDIRTRGTPGQPGFEYFFDEEETGDVKPGRGGQILGGLASLLTGIPVVGGAIGSAIDKGKGIFGKKPRDMSQYNNRGLFGIPKGTLDEDDKIPVRGDSAWQDGSLLDRWSTPINNINTGSGIPFTNAFTSGNNYPVNQNFTDNMATYTGGIEEGNTIGNDEQMYIDDIIAKQRGYR